MENKQHLPVGSQLDGHYEIIEVLGEDDFEILYLVKDTHRLQTLFVIKELFLKKISLRTESKEILTLEKSKDIFEDTKQELRVEAKKLQKSHYRKDDIQTYGYFEENNTIYIIMEFVNDAGLNSYLNIRLKKENKKILPSVKEEYGLKQEKPKSTIFLKILLVAVIVFIGLGFYAYKMIEENKIKAQEKPTVEVKNTPIHHPELTNRIQNIPESKTPPSIENKQEEIQKEVNKSIPNGAEYITTEKNSLEEGNREEVISNGVPKDEIYTDNEVEEIPIVEKIPRIEATPVIENTPIKEIPIEEQFQVPYIAPTPSVSLGTKIENPQIQNSNSISLGTPITKNITPKVSLKSFNRNSIQNFLTTFIASSATGSVESIASHYDSHVDKYFSLRNITHSEIKKDKTRYNRKWTNRNFEIISFYMTKTYQKEGTQYCDIKTKTKWNVSTNSGKHASGTSRGFMTLKNTTNGFKVTSIYTLK